MRLSQHTLGQITPSVARFSYDRRAQSVGIVHFGIGAFHRAHQAWYTDRAMDGGDRNWAIAGVSMRSAGVADQLDPQGGLYTVTERTGAGDMTRLVGAVRKVLVANRDQRELLAHLVSPKTRIVSFTVTEKGYCRAGNGNLDLAAAGVGTFYSLLAQAFAVRRDAGTGGLTLLSCDNLSHNGQQLERLIREYLTAQAPALLQWFEAECSCPSTMVDRIVPTTRPSDLEELSRSIGLDDQGAVFTEPFSQWVIEDRFAGERPAWENVGAQLVSDVAPYETAKLRMLNGAHSALAYIGLQRGYTFVHEAVADPEIRKLAINLMIDEAAPTIAAAPGQDLSAYANALIQRFENPRLQHRLSQIAMDGSQKIPQRWLETLASQATFGKQCPALLDALAAWLLHVRGDGHRVDDPRQNLLAEAWLKSGRNGIIDAMFRASGIIRSQWAPSDADRSYLSKRLDSSS